MSTNESRSPAGDVHPGTVTFDDQTSGRTWTEAASGLPETVAWVAVGDRFEAVVRVEITGVPDHRRITKFGRDGAMLESTVQAPPRPAPAVPTPTPTTEGP